MVKLFYWLLFLPLFVIIVVFAVNNPHFTDLDLWPVFGEPVSFPIFGVALIALFVGFLLGGLVSWIGAGRSRQRVRELRRTVETDQREMAVLRETIAKLERAGQKPAIPAKPAAAA